MEPNKNPDNERRMEGPVPMQPQVIEVMQEHVVVSTETVDTARVIIHKRVEEEERTLNIPLIQEGYEVEHHPVKKIVDTMPSVRQEEDRVVIPVVREVLVVEKRYEIVEEVHVVKRRTEVPHMQDITLLKEVVEVERIPIDRDRDIDNRANKD
jgi:uncharacterized protein (TIGR02271 family)